jgi:hypothetical protein
MFLKINICIFLLINLFSTSLQISFVKYTIYENMTVSDRIQSESELIIKKEKYNSKNSIYCNIECNMNPNCSLIKLDENFTCHIYSHKASQLEIIPSNNSMLMLKSNLIPCPTNVLYFNEKLQKCKCLNDSYL